MTGPASKPAPLIEISTVKSRTNTRVTKESFSWDRLVDEKFRKPIRTHETFADYMAMAKDDQDQIKDVGGFIGGVFSGKTRKKSELTHRTLLVLDLDHAAPDYLPVVQEALAGTAYVLHATHKHQDSAPRQRLVAPLSRPATPEESVALARAVADTINIEWMDVTGDEVSRIMYWPSISTDVDYAFHEGLGEPVDVDRVLSESYIDWRDVEEWPVSSRHTKSALPTNKRAKDPREKPGLVGAFCRVFDIDTAILEFLGDEYVPAASPDRYTYRHGTTANGAVVYDGLWLYSHHESDPCAMQLVNAYDLVRIHKFGDLDAVGKECSR